MTSQINTGAEPMPLHELSPYNQNETYIIGALTVATLLPLQFYLHQKYDIPLKKPEFGARIVSFIHSVIVAVGCVFCIFTHTGAEYDSPATRLEGNLMMFSCMYFTVDQIFMCVYNFDMVYTLHHLVTISSTAYPAFLGEAGYCLCCIFLCGEVSNPFLHGRWLLNANGYKNTGFFSIVTQLWFISFIGARLFYGPFLMWSSYWVLPIIFTFLFSGILVFSIKALCENLKAEWNGEWWEN